MAAMSLPIVGIDWPEAHRITTERPPIPLFEAAINPEELDILREQLDAVGEIDLNRVPLHRQIAGPDSSPVMGCFVYPGASRFSDGDFGICYAARTLPAAFAEVGYHLGRTLRESRASSCSIERVLFVVRVQGELHRLVGAESAWPGVDSAIPDDYAVSRRLGAELHAGGSEGLVYTSVRRAPDECVAVFDPRRIEPAAPRGTVRFTYDAESRAVTSAAEVQPL